MLQTNVHNADSTGVTNVTKASRSKINCNTRKDRTLPTKSVQEKRVEDHRRNNKTDLNHVNRVDSSISSRRTVINSNSNATHKICNNGLTYNHRDACFGALLNDVYTTSACYVLKNKCEKQTWRATGRTFTKVGYCWRPTGRMFSLGNHGLLTMYPRTRPTRFRMWKKTGRTFPLETMCSDNYSNGSLICNTSNMTDVLSDSVNDYTMCANHSDPFCDRGSMSSSYPYLSDFKCRSYKSSFGIWTQAAQNI